MMQDISRMDVERYLLSACFLNPSIISEIKDVLLPSDFGIAIHQRIFEVALKLGNDFDVENSKSFLDSRDMGYLCSLIGEISLFTIVPFLVCIVKQAKWAHDHESTLDICGEWVDKDILSFSRMAQKFCASKNQSDAFKS